MRYSVLTIHPDFFSGFVSEGLISKASSKGLIGIDLINIRDFSDPPHFRVDDKPYGGGAGMILKPEPIVRALESIPLDEAKTRRTIVFSAKGKPFTQRDAERLAKYDNLIFVCGRYEGIDERVIANYADEEIRIGDYILMGGEVAAQVVIEATARLIPGVLGNKVSVQDESFSVGDEKEYPQYTRPADFRGFAVPEALQNGNHREIEKWRAQHR